MRLPHRDKVNQISSLRGNRGVRGRMEGVVRGGMKQLFDIEILVVISINTPEATK